MKEVLGIEPMDAKETVTEMAYSLIETGFIKKTKKYKGPGGIEVSSLITVSSRHHSGIRTWYMEMADTEPSPTPCYVLEMADTVPSPIPCYVLEMADTEPPPTPCYVPCSTRISIFQTLFAKTDLLSFQQRG